MNFLNFFAGDLIFILNVLIVIACVILTIIKDKTWQTNKKSEWQSQQISINEKYLMESLNCQGDRKRRFPGTFGKFLQTITTNAEEPC